MEMKSAKYMQAQVPFKVDLRYAGRLMNVNVHIAHTAVWNFHGNGFKNFFVALH